MGGEEEIDSFVQMKLNPCLGGVSSGPNSGKLSKP